MVNAQINIFDEIIVDNFAGGGGASTGIELATGRPVDIAINHDPAAILLHKTNHPYTMHMQASVWDVDTVEVCAGRPVGLAWFSPDCKHFSKAKGSALVDRNIRGLAWIVLRWAGTVRPRVIILENVEEFKTWGPVRNGKPIKSKSGTTFAKWLGQLRALGYAVEYRELVGADYGAPTSRKRLVLVARCDGKPIVWPERTHAPADSEEVRSGKCKPWRSAAEIIDWTIPMYSIFDSRQQIKEKYGVNAVRPLADNTMRRIIRGVDKFTIRSGKPFIVECNHSGAGHINAVDSAIGTVTQKCTMGVCNSVMAPVVFPNTDNSVGSAGDRPVHTVTTAGNQVLSCAQLMQIGQTGGGDRARNPDNPLATIVSKAEACITSAQMIQYHTEQTENVRANGLDDLLPTVDASNRYGLTAAQLVEYYGNGNPLPCDEPMRTVTTHDREALTACHIQKYFDGGYKGCGDATDSPLSTITACPRHSLCASHIVEFKGSDIGQTAERPLRTITTSAGEFGVGGCRIVKYAPGVDVGRWPLVRELLNKYCGYSLEADDLLLIPVNGGLYFIADILLRMLVPRELYRAMGFPEDYIIDRDYAGNAYNKTEQVRKCGNAVCPPMAEAVVRANYKAAKYEIRTMAELERMIAI